MVFGYPAQTLSSDAWSIGVQLIIVCFKFPVVLVGSQATRSISYPRFLIFTPIMTYYYKTVIYLLSIMIHLRGANHGRGWTRITGP